MFAQVGINGALQRVFGQRQIGQCYVGHLHLGLIHLGKVVQACVVARGRLPAQVIYDLVARAALPLRHIKIFGQRHNGARLVEQALQVPVLRQIPDGVLLHQRLNFVVHHVHDNVAQIIFLKNGAALVVDHLALFVDHIVILNHMLANIKVVALNFFLRLLNALAQDAILQRHIVLHVHAIHQPFYALAAKAHHQLVF